jgi:hypothetical protein
MEVIGLKVTEVDISEHIISVKLRRPFLQIRKVTRFWKSLLIK